MSSERTLNISSTEQFAASADECLSCGSFGTPACPRTQALLGEHEVTPQGLADLIKDARNLANALPVRDCSKT